MSFFTEKRNPGSSITAQEIDTMNEEDLFYLGEVYTRIGIPGDLAVFNEFRLARRLYRCNRIRFIDLIRQMIPSNLPQAFYWTSILMQNKDDRLSDVLQWLKQPLEEYLSGLEGMHVSDALHVKILGDSFTALLPEISEPAERYWKNKYKKYTSVSKKSEDISRFLTVREARLGISHADSVMLLRRLGWQPADIMLAYVYSLTRSYTAELSPDCVITSVDDDQKTAEELLDKANYKKYFSKSMHPSYYTAMALRWIDYLYLYYGYKDDSFLREKHTSKKLAAYCQSVYSACHDSNFEQNIFENELRHFGLLASEEALDWDNAKFIKKQRQVFLRACICHYQCKYSELLNAIAICPHPELFTSLVWGSFRDDTLAAAFMFDTDMTARKEDGERYLLPEEADIGLVSPVELTNDQLRGWVQKIKKTGTKPVIPQLAKKFELSDVDLSVFNGAVTKHITIYTRAGKWGMYMGYDKGSHTCCHMIDPLHKIGAQICFSRITDGPEYNNDEVEIRGVTFYKLGKMRYGDCIPDQAAVLMNELPPRFVHAALSAFRQLAGIH